MFGTETGCPNHANKPVVKEVQFKNNASRTELKQSIILLTMLWKYKPTSCQTSSYYLEFPICLVRTCSEQLYIGVLKVQL